MKLLTEQNANAAAAASKLASSPKTPTAELRFSPSQALGTFRPVSASLGSLLTTNRGTPDSDSNASSPQASLMLSNALQCWAFLCNALQC